MILRKDNKKLSRSCGEVGERHFPTARILTLAKRRQSTRGIGIEFGEIDDNFRHALLRDEMARVVIRSPCIHYLVLDRKSLSTIAIRGGANALLELL